MTLAYLEGFESVTDSNDMSARGWKPGTSIGFSGQNSMTVPSRTGVAGRGLMLQGPYWSNSPAWLPNNGLIDFGMIDTGQSIHSLWQSGGFSVGFNATFNKGNQVQVAAGYTYQIVYDGSQYYWAVALVAAVWTVAYSPDLINWMAVATPPPGIGNMSKIMVFGSGSTATVVVTNWINNNPNTAYYSTSFGASWALFTDTNSTFYVLYSIANKSTTAPYISASWVASGGVALYYSASLLGATTRIGTLVLDIQGSSNYSTAYGRYINDVILFSAQLSSATFTAPPSGSNYWLSCLDSIDPTNAANWVQSPASTIGQMNDITYFPVTGLWYAAGYGGIASSSQTGTVAVPKGPSGAWSTVLATPAVAVWSITTNGTVLVAVGQDPVTTTLGAIWTSTNGTTWTKVNRFILQSIANATGNAFTNVIWDGSRFILTGPQSNNVIATSPDGIAWTATYYPDYTEAAIGSSSCASCLGVYSGTLNPGTYVGVTPATPGSYVQYSTTNAIVGVGFVAAAISGNTRAVSGFYVAASSAGQTSTTSIETPTTNVAINPLSHYYELIATATGTVNQFTWQIAIDGVIVGTLPPGASNINGQFALTTDTAGAAHLLINLPRSGNWTVIDDIYLTTFAADSAGNSGQLGICNVVPFNPLADVSDQFTRPGSVASDAAAVVGSLGNSEGGVTATAVGAKDIYSTSNGIPANYKVRAIQVEAYFSKSGGTGANCTVGVISNGVESDSAQVTASTTTPVLATLLLENDPKTAAPWTLAGANAAEIVITKVT